MGSEQQQQRQQMCGLDLPPGFRFHPTDEELITFYLTPKVLDRAFCATAIAEVDLNKCEPWDLPGKAKMGEKEWYFYCQKDRKYPTGMRTNRATEAGYWKATGKDKDIFRGAMQQLLVGMKKTLVFYKGRAPRGEKTNWVMHEYRLILDAMAMASSSTSPAPHAPGSSSSSSKVVDEWVVCRIFHKSSGIKKPAVHTAPSMMYMAGIPMHMGMAMAGAPMQMPDQVDDLMSTTMSSSSSLPPHLMFMDPASTFTVAPPATSYQQLASHGAMGSAALQLPLPTMNNGPQFAGNATAQPMFYHQQMQQMQMDMGGGGFMGGPASEPSSMVSQESEQNKAAAEISSVACNMGGAMDVSNTAAGMWKY